MSRKREKPYHSGQVLSSTVKRCRPSLPELVESTSTKPSVLIIGLSLECSILDLKSRFEIYGYVSQICINRDRVGYVTFCSKDSANATITASLDPSFDITIDSKNVLFFIRVVWSLRKCGKGILEKGIIKNFFFVSRIQSN